MQCLVSVRGWSALVLMGSVSVGAGAQVTVEERSSFANNSIAAEVVNSSPQQSEFFSETDTSGALTGSFAFNASESLSVMFTPTDDPSDGDDEEPGRGTPGGGTPGGIGPGGMGGDASASGSLIYSDAVTQATADRLDITFDYASTGSVSSNGDGLAESSQAVELIVVFEIDEAMNFAASGTLGLDSMNDRDFRLELSQASLRDDPVFSAGRDDLTLEEMGTLEAGRYRFTLEVSQSLNVSGDGGTGDQSNTVTGTLSLTPVPEPASLAILAGGSVLLGVRRHRRG
ncbi:MAG: PEP-CTERM sorting domain-containing protein [Planctomycetota bacterium]